MQTIGKTRKYQYDDKIGRVPYINDWKRNPYTFLKGRFYMEASALLVYLLLKTKIKPNSVTIIYGLAGILGGILLAIPTNKTQIFAILIFFTKGILDWSDGHLARVTGRTSLTGDILDVYGAYLNSLGLQIGLGFYVAQKADMMIFWYLIPLIPLFYSANLKNFSRNSLFDSYIIAEEINKYRNRATPESLIPKNGRLSEIRSSRFASVYHFIKKILDDRARSVDFICLLILIEIYTQIFVTWIIFLILVFKQLLIFCASFYDVVKNGWAESKLDDKITEIFKFMLLNK